jgi:hypothetical protein
MRWESLEPRQITGRPFEYFGYVRPVGSVRLEHCHEGRHRRRGAISGAVFARRCAEREARRRNRAVR